MRLVTVAMVHPAAPYPRRINRSRQFGHRSLAQLPAAAENPASARAMDRTSNRAGTAATKRT